MKITIPKDFPVRPLKRNQPAEDRATCGTCGLSWDDAIPTSLTPAPAARCPFEEFHDYEPPKLTRAQKRENARRAGHARQTLEAYAEITDIGEDDETTLCDMLADMMHLLGREAVEGRVFMAAEHYEAERRGEE